MDPYLYDSELRKHYYMIKVEINQDHARYIEYHS